MNLDDFEIEERIFKIQKKLDKIIDESNLEYIIDWDEEGERGLWNYDFAIMNNYDEVEKAAIKMADVPHVSTYVNENDDVYKWTICCYIDIRDEL